MWPKQTVWTHALTFYFQDSVAKGLVAGIASNNGDSESMKLVQQREAKFAQKEEYLAKKEAELAKFEAEIAKLTDLHDTSTEEELETLRKKQSEISARVAQLDAREKILSCSRVGVGRRWQQIIDCGRCRPARANWRTSD